MPSGYATIGAGARATASGSTGGQGFGVGEDFGRDPAGVVFTTRTGIPAGHGLVYMPIADTIDTNDSALYGAEVGLLGDELARAGISRAVVANGDGSDPSTPETRYSPWRRAAVAGLMTSDGKVPGGRVDTGLLRKDASAPFGVRLDATRVARAFSGAWTPGSVVLVEGSDLVRADLAARFASEDQAVEIRAARARGHRPARRPAARPGGRGGRGDRGGTLAALRPGRAHGRRGAGTRLRARSPAVDHDPA